MHLFFALSLFALGPAFISAIEVANQASRPLSPPPLKHVFTAYLTFDLTNHHRIKIPQGERIISVVTKGNWTLPSGELLAELAPSTAVEQGYVDSDGKFQVDLPYVMRFIQDGTFAYVKHRAVENMGVSGQGTDRIETDSPTYPYLTQIHFVTPSFFRGAELEIQYWVPEDDLATRFTSEPLNTRKEAPHEDL